MKIRYLYFEGTKDEFPAVQHLLAGEESGLEASSELQDDIVSGSNILTVDVVERAFTRIPLSSAQKNFLSVLYKNAEEGVLLPDIAKRMKVTPSQVAGVRGAFGRRNANTEGWPEGVDFCDYEWNENTWRYWLNPAVIEVIREGVVKI